MTLVKVWFFAIDSASACFSASFDTFRPSLAPPLTSMLTVPAWCLPPATGCATMFWGSRPAQPPSSAAIATRPRRRTKERRVTSFILAPYFLACALKMLVSTSSTISGGDLRVSEVWNEFPVAIGKLFDGLRNWIVSSSMYIVMSHIHLST